MRLDYVKFGKIKIEVLQVNTMTVSLMSNSISHMVADNSRVLYDKEEKCKAEIRNHLFVGGEGPKTLARKRCGRAEAAFPSKKIHI